MSNMFRLQPFSEALKISRKKKKMTQTDLAEKVGISAMSISRYEAGDTIPDMGILGSICVALKDDSLLDAWIHSKASENGSELGFDPLVRQRHFIKVKDITYRKYWDELVQRGTWKFQKRLVYIAQYLQNMNGLGFRKTMELIEALSMVPEYKDESGWAFKKDSVQEDIDDGEGETEGE